MSKQTDKNEISKLIIEQSADNDGMLLASQLQLTPQTAQNTRNTLASFIRSYKNKPSEQPAVVWLDNEFALYPQLWLDETERKKAANTITDTVESYYHHRTDLDKHFDKGLSQASWLDEKLRQGVIASGHNNFTEYAGNIDVALDRANQNNINVLYRNDGQINQQYNLDGFIAEHHHANSFNLEAAAQGSEYHAEVLEPGPGETYGKSSVDIVIKDGDGKIVRRYQAKYGKDAESTEQLLKKGDYRGQRKLVPKGQAEQIENSTDTIEVGGIESKPLTKEQAKEMQRKAQLEYEAKQYDWSQLNGKALSKNIAKQAAAGALLSVGFQGGRILGRRIWNGLTGKKNPDVEQDLQEFIHSSIRSAGQTGIAVAATGGITVAIKSGWFGKALKNTPVGHIANFATLGIENSKILYKFSKGELTGKEAVDQAGCASVSMIGAIAAGGKLASAGAGLGSVFGPVGTALGGVAGGLLGSMAGSAVGEGIYQAGKAIVSSVARGISSVSSSIGSSVSSACSFVGSLFS
ncbi:hypothetical protein BIT28_02145 [Photobacterium proteolyticum]|uniref:Uncharacterized protein n=1 Tax=Photobacterium proteolyticum TaxID=1903952 RepID=A0A1Q9GVI3_9GAMM|nr:hypothetical protein [Photobacterium proteolyticum]OLQ79159.1 hypothetical protein BIT28_02145 [Photobacterium proteolyticum]